MTMCKICCNFFKIQKYCSVAKKLNKSFLFESHTDEDLPAVDVGGGEAAPAVAVAAVCEQVLALGPRRGDHRRTSCAQLPTPEKGKK